MKNVVRYSVLILFCSIFAVTLMSSNRFTDIYVLPKQFYFVFSSLTALCILFLVILFIKKPAIVKFNYIDFALLLFSVFIIVRYFALHQGNIKQEIIVLFILILIYFSVREFIFISKSTNYLKIFLFFLILFSFVQAVIGILQLAGILENKMPDFKIGGTYGNPGPFTNYLVSVIPVSLGIILLNKKKSGLDKLLKIFSFLAFISSVFIIIFSQARTSWIAALISIFFIFNYKYSILKRINLSIKSAFVKIAIIVFLCIISITIGYKLYNLKKDSSLGRLFIWETTLDIIKENPVFGTGYTTFLVEHNKKQADYFIEHPEDTKRGYLADNVLFAFNDYLEIAAENGLIGLALFLVLIILALVVKISENKDEGKDGYLFFSVKIALVAILISSLFSYPLNTLPILLNFFVYLAILSAYNEKNVEISLNKYLVKSLSFILIIVIAWLFNFEYNRYKSNLRWAKAARFIKTREKGYALNIYKEVYPVISYDGNFLYNYGAELSLIGDYNKSLKILKEAESKMNDADFYSYLGNTYDGLFMFNEAEDAFIYANRIIPHKFYPKYRLVLLYEKTGRKGKALQLGNEIISMPSKVESDVVGQIKIEMENFIQTSY